MCLRSVSECSTCWGLRLALASSWVSGVWCTSTHSTVFNVDNSPSVGSQSLCVMKTFPLDADLPFIPTLLHDIRAKTSDDAFLGDVLQAVLDSDDNFYRDFFLDDNRVLCFRRTEDVVARVYVPAVSREAVLRSAQGDSLLAGHPGIDRTIASVAHSFYWPGLHADVSHFVRFCPTCAASKGSNHGTNVWGFHNSLLYLFNHLRVGQWTWLDHCLPLN